MSLKIFKDFKGLTLEPHLQELGALQALSPSSRLAFTPHLRIRDQRHGGPATCFERGFLKALVEEEEQLLGTDPLRLLRLDKKQILRLNAKS